MRCHRRSPGYSKAIRGLLGALLVVTVTSSASAQSRIAPEIISSDSLSDSQQETITGYLETMCGRLHEGEAGEVTLARRRLLEPMNTPGATEGFLATYTRQLQPCIEKAMASDRLIVRLNGMIVVTRMTAASALPLIRQGFEDENAAVRYWAVKCVREIGRSADREWPTEVQYELLDLMTPKLRNESAGPVVQQLMVSMVELDVQESVQRTLDALNRRVQDHFANPGRPLQAEQNGLRELLRRLLEEGDAPTRIRRELARTAYRYMRLAGTQLSEGDIPDTHRPAYQDVLRVADTIMRQTNSDLNGPADIPAGVERDVQNGNWDAVLVKADRWQTILLDSPFNFAESELALQ